MRMWARWFTFTYVTPPHPHVWLEDYKNWSYGNFHSCLDSHYGYAGHLDSDSSYFSTASTTTLVVIASTSMGLYEYQNGHPSVGNNNHDWSHDHGHDTEDVYVHCYVMRPDVLLWEIAPHWSHSFLSSCGWLLGASIWCNASWNWSWQFLEDLIFSDADQIFRLCHPGNLFVPALYSYKTGSNEMSGYKIRHFKIFMLQIFLAWHLRLAQRDSTVSPIRGFVRVRKNRFF